jgi:hypothetical protein
MHIFELKARPRPKYTRNRSENRAMSRLMEDQAFSSRSNLGFAYPCSRRTHMNEDAVPLGVIRA